MDIEALTAIRETIKQGCGPDRGLDAKIAEHVGNWRSLPGDNWLGPHGELVVPYYTSSVDACISLLRERLPGWAWKIGTCCISDDAWVVPDFNCPVHGARLREEFGEIEFDSIWDTGIDIDRRPPGDVPRALLDGIFSAVILLSSKKLMAAFAPEQGGKCPSADCSGTLEFERQGDCTCHIAPPCGNCIEAPLVCSECGWSTDDAN